MQIKNPYQETPYQLLSDPELGPLSTNANKKDIQDRYGRLIGQGRPSSEISKVWSNAWSDLKSSSKRLVWDIFCVSVEQEQQLLQELANQQFSFRRSVPMESPPVLGREFLALDKAPPPLHLTDREVTLTLPSLDDPVQTFRAWLSQVNFEV